MMRCVLIKVQGRVQGVAFLAQSRKKAAVAALKKVNKG
jgi:acylphosphatase